MDTRAGVSMGLQRAWTGMRWRLQGRQVFALVGRSGTGKSYRAALVADRHGIEATIDDGLLIAGGRILAGHSAKREANLVTATKTACFFDPAHRQAVREALAQGGFHRILLLGTSERMVARNCRALGLPPPRRIIRIEEIASDGEIAAARRERTVHGHHVIPLPLVEVRRSYPKLLAESLTVWLHRSRRLFSPPRAVEKSIVRPAFSGSGAVTITEPAIREMVRHCIGELAPELEVRRIKLAQRPSGCVLRVDLAVPLEHGLPATLHRLHGHIVSELESCGGVTVARLSLSIDSIAVPASGPPVAPVEAASPTPRAGAAPRKPRWGR